MNHIIARGHKERNSPAYFVCFLFVSIKYTNENDPFRSGNERKMIASMTS